MEESYTILQVFARSWGTVFLFLAFVGVLIVAFRPGSRRLHEDAANVPFNHEDAPAPDPAAERESPER